MSENIIVHPPGGPLQYSGPVGKVLRVDGHAPQRRAAPDEDGWGQIEYHSGGYLTAVAGRPIETRDRRPPAIAGETQRLDDTRDADSPYWKARRRAEIAAERRANPDFGLVGRCVPYGVVLDGGLGDQVVFSPATEWVLRRPDLPLLIEHGGLLGTCRLDEVPNGLHAHGNIYAARRNVIGDRHDLSPKLTLLDTVTRPDGVLEVLSASLTEISLVARPHWSPHTSATIWRLAA